MPQPLPEDALPLMRLKLNRFAWVALGLGLVGCQRAPRSVVMDLDAVAKAMGRDAAIAAKVEAATQQLNTQLLQAAREMEEELKKIQTQIGSAPSPEQLAKLRQARQQVQQNIQNNKLLAENARNRVRGEQILLLRDEVRPIAAQIAKSRHADVVLLASQEVMWFAPSADITSEIIAKMRADASNPATAAPAPPPSKETDAEPATNSPPKKK